MRTFALEIFVISPKFQQIKNIKSKTRAKKVNKNQKVRKYFYNLPIKFKVAFEGDKFEEWNVATNLPRWFAPESLVDTTNFTQESHVWQLSICFWEVMSRGMLPYGDIIDNSG